MQFTQRFFPAVIISLMITGSLFTIMLKLIEPSSNTPFLGSQTSAIFFKKIEDSPPPAAKIRTPPKLPEPTPSTKPSRPNFTNPTDITTPPVESSIPTNTTTTIGELLEKPGYSNSGGPGKLMGNQNVRPFRQFDPAYPQDALRNGIEGYVTLAFTVNAKGRVYDIQIIDSKPKRVFDKAAIRAIKLWQFKPAISNGIAIDARAEQTISFSLEE